MTSAQGQDREFSDQVRSAVFWRSGSQILSQIVMWGATLAVIRILDPRDYGLFAMSQAILALLNFLNGYGFASSLVQAETVDDRRIGQAFGMLLLLNFGLAALQFTLAPLAADYYNQPMVADLLRVQALLYLATPFIALPDALLARALDFRKQAKANFAAAIAGAATALACALAGWGVWTLVAAPMALFYTRAIGLTIAARLLVRPRFDFRGAGAMFSYGGAVLLSQFFWIIQSQADIFIAGPSLSAHQLGIYAEALFLTQIVVSKFVPPLNDVAFPAYARIQDDPTAVAWSFRKAVRLIMLVTAPIYLGLAVTAHEIVEILFGAKWLEMVPLVQILALAMPFITLQILFAPAVNAMGRPHLTMRAAAVGAVIFIAVFLFAIQFGAMGLALGWLGAAPLLLIATAAISLPIIGVSPLALARAALPGLALAALMAAAVLGIEQILPPMAPLARFALLVMAGGTLYPLLVRLLTPSAMTEIIGLVFRKKPVAA